MSSFQIVSVLRIFSVFFIGLLTYDVWPRYNCDSTPIGGLALLEAGQIVRGGRRPTWLDALSSSPVPF